MRRAEVLFLLAFVCAAAAAGELCAQEQPMQADAGAALVGDTFTLYADEASYDRERNLYEASGHVRVVQAGGRTLTADWMAFNGTTQIGVATGRVRIVDRQDVVVADFATVDLRSLVALAQNAELDTPGPGLQVRGERVQRTGVNTYSIENANFTTCRCPPGKKQRPWELDA